MVEDTREYRYGQENETNTWSLENAVNAWMFDFQKEIKAYLIIFILKIPCTGPHFLLLLSLVKNIAVFPSQAPYNIVEFIWCGVRCSSTFDTLHNTLIPDNYTYKVIYTHTHASMCVHYFGRSITYFILRPWGMTAEFHLIWGDASPRSNTNGATGATRLATTLPVKVVERYIIIRLIHVHMCTYIYITVGANA